MILLSDFERASPLPPKRVARHVLDFKFIDDDRSPALGAKAPVVCQAAAWVGRERARRHDIVAPGDAGVAEGGRRRQPPIAVREGLGYRGW
ncbi:hypothetical protein U8Q05_06770 [Rhizobium ruizarguesonis]|nr:hypothetical protein U8Q05_06770 [Rhizobium ruizarguesonis]